MVNRRFQSQMDLMVRLLPHVMREDIFALKGGTAINLFHRPLPRLSVDIDLTYLPLKTRDGALEQISVALERVAERAQRAVRGIGRVARRRQEGWTVALTLQGEEGIVKIEPNTVIRGVVFDCVEMELHSGALKHLEPGTWVKSRTLSFADLFGGKICAALDRQHPRDLFDVHGLLAEEGLTQEVRKAFLVYLISHDRPLRELLDPRQKDMTALYENELEGMMRVKLPFSTIENTLPELVKRIRRGLTDDERRFLISFKEGNPRWEWLGIPDVERLPAPAWKLANIRKMETTKHKNALSVLKRILSI